MRFKSDQEQKSGRANPFIVVKEKVEFWDEAKNNLWALSLLLCKCGRTSEKKMFPEKYGSSNTLIF